MTPLRQRFIDDLRLRNYSPRTIDTYVWHVAAFAKHFGRSPDLLGVNDVRDYQLHLLAQKRSWSRFNQAVCALRFLFGTTLGRPEQLPLIPYGKRPFGGPAQVLKYLARYTHRVAISNSRLLDLSEGRVTFRYKDYADAHQQKSMTLDAEVFLRRFVQHVLPKSFVKIRHYGLLANAQHDARLALCRRLLLVSNVAAAVPGADAFPIEPAQPRCCPNCGGTRLIYTTRGGSWHQPEA